jgi:hypothetical protein
MRPEAEESRARETEKRQLTSPQNLETFATYLQT